MKYGWSVQESGHISHNTENVSLERNLGKMNSEVKIIKSTIVLFGYTMAIWEQTHEYLTTFLWQEGTRECRHLQIN